MDDLTSSLVLLNVVFAREHLNNIGPTKNNCKLAWLVDQKSEGVQLPKEWRVC